MGTYLSKPITDKESSEGENELFRFGVAAMQGWRSSMEDAHATVLSVADEEGVVGRTGFFGVFDGHGGREVAIFAAKHLVSELVKTEGWKAEDLEKAIKQAYLSFDASLVREEFREELQQLSVNQVSRPPGEESYEDSQVAGLKEALMSGDDLDADWEGDEFDGAYFEPMLDLEDGSALAALGDEDVMTRADSDDEGEGKDAEIASDIPKDMEDSSDFEEGIAGPFDLEDEIRELEEQSSSWKSWPSYKYHGPAAGCTAVVALIAGGKLIVANAGDSRCVASRGGVAHGMTHDHKPTDVSESQRIHNAGGYVTDDGRVNGILNLSRAFGDMDFKRNSTKRPEEQMITADPDVSTLELQPGDEFLVLACDGIWDVLTNQQAVDFVREGLCNGQTPKAVCEAMCDKCLAPGVHGSGEGCDNMSAMVVVLKDFAQEEILKGATPIPPSMP